MLGVRLICVGKLGEKFWAQAVKEYEKRLGAYCKLEILRGRDRAGARPRGCAYREQDLAGRGRHRDVR